VEVEALNICLFNKQEFAHTAPETSELLKRRNKPHPIARDLNFQSSGNSLKSFAKIDQTYTSRETSDLMLWIQQQCCQHKASALKNIGELRHIQKAWTGHPNSQRNRTFPFTNTFVWGRVTSKYWEKSFCGTDCA
jgi:hypothetical protein